MALIICPECGKQFSDKAPACPNCGCPTDTMRQAVVELGKEECTRHLLEEVRRTREQAKAAEEQFDAGNLEIQLKAESSIDLFGGNAKKRAAELAADAQRVCDNLYAAYQTLITLLDQTCRPLLAASPSGEAVGEVAETIRFLNEESEIENNFSASLNDVGLGNVACVKYVPSMESRLVQAYWEKQYEATPEAKAIRERDQARAQRRRAEDVEREKTAASAAGQEARELQIRKEHAEEIRKMCDGRTREYRKRINLALKQKKEQLVRENEKQIRALTEQKESLIRQLSGLGVLKIKEKKEAKEGIEKLEVQIKELSDPSIVNARAAELQKRAEKEIQKFQTKITAYYDKRFPYEPAKKEADKKLGNDVDYCKAIIRKDFLEFMKKKNGHATGAEMVKALPRYDANIRAKAIGDLILKGVVCKQNEKSIIYYTLAGRESVDRLIEKETEKIRELYSSVLPPSMKPFMEDEKAAKTTIPDIPETPDFLSEQ